MKQTKSRIKRERRGFRELPADPFDHGFGYESIQKSPAWVSAAVFDGLATHADFALKIPSRKPAMAAATRARFITPSHDHSAPVAPPPHPENYRQHQCFCGAFCADAQGRQVRLRFFPDTSPSPRPTLRTPALKSIG